MGVSAPTFSIAGAQALNGDDDDRHALGEVLWADLGNLRRVEHRHAPVKRIIERGAVGMAWLLERLGGLHADGVGRHHPKHHGKVTFQVVPPRDGHGMRRQQRFAAAGWQPQANIGHPRQAGHGAVGRRSLFRLPRAQNFVKGLLGIASDMRAFKIGGEGVERGALKCFKFHCSCSPTAL